MLTKGEVAEQLLAWAGGLERRSVLPPQLTWEADQNPGRRNDEARNNGNGVNVWSAENVCNRSDGGSVLNACIDVG
jgi:hypothetical protein